MLLTTHGRQRHAKQAFLGTNVERSAGYLPFAHIHDKILKSQQCQHARMAHRAHAPVLPYRGPPGRPPLRSAAALPGLPVAVLGAGALRRGQALVAAAQRRVADAAAQACRTPRDASSCQHALISEYQSTCSLWLRSGTRLAHQSENRPARSSFCSAARGCSCA